MDIVTLAYVDRLGEENALVGDVVQVERDNHPVLVVVHCFHTATCNIERL